ncbi:MAG TPA: MraY family glycosyltransferase [Tepidisphaeraceae bacterium]|jgi:UDP-GlcNAc:undecaprenyl-phosphate GlcNAc-1-phosphate transferase
MVLPILALGAASFVISWLLTAAMIRVAPRVGFVDKPGHRKIHSNPKPLGGGVAIFGAFALPMGIGIVVVNAFRPPLIDEYANHVVAESYGLPTTTVAPDTPRDALVRAYWSGARSQTPLALTLLGVALVIHVMGLIDDRKALGPSVKLLVQLGCAAAIVIPFKDVRALTALSTIPSIILTILWITGITNAFNFLDNMDGLSAGVAAVCTTSFLVTTILIQQWFVAASLALLLGALLGFLYWNFPPAKIFMGDSGSLAIGFVLGVLTIRTTYLRAGENLAAGWYSVLAPVVVLALPLYDLIVVSMIRLARGKSPFVGDTNHFSHRLVARGMSRRTAVLCLYLVTAATAIAAILLPYVQSTFQAMLIFAQTLLVLGVVALLEQHPLPVSSSDEPADASKH